ncbi:5-guanidino-2-oxopentanoate decarboxylase [Variovorax sp. J22R133]|uniref:5-guanidino-2-oxopentanoate decarboxylase n=1 Tax=Variovorax brevis TaxID=3053503 RepID=UPI002576D827|nr:5-guanidino-2-oxopentanoate decarboxylase [Variovorax sp. J22R133]MDM0113769.1 5-guanidino-2-oxopentanoate decarboxylase [Variovorax sp. J22R133]
MKTLGEVLIELLEDYGVDHVFGIPGVHTVELYRGLARSRIRHVTPRHEQGAGFMADGYARVSGKPGVCLIITGPGMTNIATALGQAHADSVPMLVISSVNARSQLGHGNGHLHELPSQQGLIAGLTAFSHTLMQPDDLPAVLARAFAVFDSARPRPVHIEIPLDVITADASHLNRQRPERSRKPVASQPSIDDATALLARAVRPLILAGGGAVNAGPALQALAEQLGAPTALTINAKGLLPPRHPLLLGSTQSTVAVRALVREADVVLAVGTELGETDYDTVFDGGFALGGALIRVDIDTAQLSRNFEPTCTVLGDSGDVLARLVSSLRDLPHAGAGSRLQGAPSWGAERVRAVRTQLEEEWDSQFRAQRHYLRTVLDVLPGAIFAGDSTQPVYQGNLAIDMPGPRRWFNSSTGYGTLGYGLPAAVGAQLAAPGTPVVCLIGDGGLQFTLPELASAVEAGVPIVVLLWNNFGYGEIKRYMQRRDIAPIGVDIYTPDFQMLARGFGCDACRADDEASLREALAQVPGGARRKPLVIETSEAQWHEAYLRDRLAAGR